MKMITGDEEHILKVSVLDQFGVERVYWPGTCHLGPAFWDFCKFHLRRGKLGMF
jgi:hypothetical protein